MMTVYLVRHGTTQWMEKDIIHGSLDSPLNELGVIQAQFTAKEMSNIGIVKIYSSSLGRAMQSAQALSQLLNISVIPVDGLQEKGFGVMEGKTEGFFRFRRHKLFGKLLNPIWKTILALRGESVFKFKNRVQKSWERILSENQEGKIAVYCHGVVLNTILKFFINDTTIRKGSFYPFDACSITKIEVDEQNQTKLIYWNETNHLNGISL